MLLVSLPLVGQPLQVVSDLARSLLVESPLLIEPVGKAIAANVSALFPRHVVVETSEWLPLLAALALSGHVRRFMAR
jgi:hypothetical protein